MTLYRIETNSPGGPIDVEVLNGTTADIVRAPTEDLVRVTGHGTEALLRAALERVTGETYYISEDDPDLIESGYTWDEVPHWEDAEWYELAPRKVRGSRQSEAERADAGWCRLKARVTTETRDALRELAERRGESQASVLTGLIREAAGNSPK